MPRVEFTSYELCKLSGASIRSLQWWQEQEIMVPRIGGHRRYYTFSQAVDVCVIAALRGKGLHLMTARKILRLMPRLQTWIAMDDPYLIILAAGAGDYRVAMAVAVRDRARVLPLVRAAKVPAYVVAIGEIVERLR